jgi:GT2 family glycosyltransferase
MLFMQADYPKIAIVILNWNGLQDTLECLRSIQKITYPNYTTVVIDNGSKGNDAEIIKEKFGDFVYMVEEDKNLGFAGGCNVGIRWALQSGAKYILLLNNDTVVDAGFLTELVSIAQNNLQIGIVGPKVYYYEQPKKIFNVGGKVNFFTGRTLFIGQGSTDDRQFDNLEEVDFVVGCALLIKEEAIRRIGLLNEKYFSYYEETEWCTKVRKAGFKVFYVPKAKIWHKSPKTRTSELEKYYLTRNRFLFVKRNSTSFQFIIFNAFFIATDLMLQIRYKIVFKPELFMAYLKGVRDGLGTYSSAK